MRRFDTAAVTATLVFGPADQTSLEHKPLCHGVHPGKLALLNTRCDLGSLADVAGAVRAAGDGFQPLTGVVHAGGVLEDAALRNQTAARVRHVFAPKLGAAMGLTSVRAVRAHQ